MQSAADLVLAERSLPISPRVTGGGAHPDSASRLLAPRFYNKLLTIIIITMVMKMMMLKTEILKAVSCKIFDDNDAGPLRLDDKSVSLMLHIIVCK